MKLAQGLVHLVWPRESNNQKARLLHSSSLFFLALILIFYQGLIQFLPSFFLQPQILGYAANIPAEEVIRLTNEKRVQAGLEPLETNDVLSQAAQAKAAHMLNFDYWAHVAPDGTEPWFFFQSTGYRYRYAGENLARDFSNPAAVVDAWMASPTHKENLLSPKYKEIGVAVVEGDLAGTDTTLVVQFFGTNLADTLPVQPIAGSQSTGALNPVPATVAEETETLPSPEAPVVTQTEPLTGPQAQVSPFNITKGFSLGLVVLLSGVLITDTVVTSQKRVTRITGRPLAHLAFLGMILAILLIARAGQIL